MAEVDGQEKTEQASGKKLHDAREKGQVAKSVEINSLAVFGSGLTLIFLTRGLIGEEFQKFSIKLFGSLDKLTLNPTILQSYFIQWSLFFFICISPILVGVLAVALISNIAQVGMKFTGKVFKPNLGKFNPLNGIKRIFFSASSVLEICKSLVKLFIIGLFTYSVISKMIEDTTLLTELSITEIVSFMLDSAFALIWKVTLCFVVIASADFIFQRFKFRKEMMMTKQEVKEEYKQQEGDPHIKSRIRKQMFSMARKRMMKDVPKADVVITNPTHFAIALKYEMNKDAAPRVLAKGMDELAQRIKKIAMENNVPLYEDRELARALYKTTEIGDMIPAKLFKAVAQILAYIYQMKKLRKKRSIV
jgi:flagellar biosynthesis protein FlhB